MNTEKNMKIIAKKIVTLIANIKNITLFPMFFVVFYCLTKRFCCLGAIYFSVHPRLDPDEQDGRCPRGGLQPGGEGW